MADYELREGPIPGNPQQAQQFVVFLETVAQNGAELVSTMPAKVAGRVICIFRVQQKGLIGKFDDKY